MTTKPDTETRDTTMIHVRVPSDLRKKLAIIAAAEETSMTAIINGLIENYVRVTMEVSMRKAAE